MRVFVTGASGWIGSATVDELLAADHQVIGLARSEESAASLEAKGAAALRGDLDDLESLGRGAAQADAVVHLANKHDFGPESDRAERAAVQTLADALVGSDKPLVVANGLSDLSQLGRPAVESDPSPEVGQDSGRGGAENLALDYVDHGVRTVIVRFAPSVHGQGDWGFVKFMVDAARRQGASGYIDDGQTQWSAVHRFDAARLIRLGLEQAPAGARLHAVAEESIATRSIAEAIGEFLKVPVTSVAADQAGEHFGFLAGFLAMSMTGSSAATRELLGWDPTGPTLLQDIHDGAYTDA